MGDVLLAEQVRPSTGGALDTALHSPGGPDAGRLSLSLIAGLIGVPAPDAAHPPGPTRVTSDPGRQRVTD